MGETFTDPNLRRAAWTGCALSAFQQLSGINAIIFYSSKLFEDTSLGANQATALIMTVNCLAVVGAVPQVNFLGRKTLMFVWYLLCSIFLFIMGFSVIKSASTIELIMCLGFVASFEFGPGPITWMYMSEIMNDQGVSMATVINWGLVLIVGSTTTIMANNLGGYMFILFGVFSTCATLFTFFCMKETKGLSEAEVARLYRADRDMLD